ncbi:MAG: MerR family transcriptional regulator [Clostridiales bacterium]|nr:MerR family transcriptional regulator [Clostridiales bacterium]
MSKYTTGEIAKLCSVTVRTVQYYDTRGILVPTELSEGGRRLYSDNDLKKMQIICFLRELGLSIDSISQMLKEENSNEVISLLLEEQEKVLKKEIEENQSKLDKLKSLEQGLKSFEKTSVESIGDVAYIMQNKKKQKRFHTIILLCGIPVSVFQLVAIILWITKGLWWLFLIWLAVAVIYGVVASIFYFNRASYICPECHEKFKPNFKESFFANHTPATRKLTCSNCGYNGFCIEVIGEKKQNENF